MEGQREREKEGTQLTSLVSFTTRPNLTLEDPEGCTGVGHLQHSAEFTVMPNIRCSVHKPEGRKQVKRPRNCFLGMSGRKLAAAWLQVLLGSSPNR